jgi:hypothetical protein
LARLPVVVFKYDWNSKSEGKTHRLLGTIIIRLGQMIQGGRVGAEQSSCDLNYLIETMPLVAWHQLR